MTTTTVTPKIWIGCLAAYNNGKHHGEWVDAAVDEDEIWEAQKRIIATSPEQPFAEEHYIADHEGFAPYRVHEYANLSTVAQVARLIEEHGPAFAAWLANDESVLTDANDHELEEGFRESYRGEWDSEKAFAEEESEQLGLPGVGFVYKQTSANFAVAYEPCLDELSPYIDWDSVTRATMEDCWSADADGGNVYIFRSY